MIEQRKIKYSTFFAFQYTLSKLKTSYMNYSLSDYQYSLPPELIAQEAATPRDSARLMVIEKKSWTITSEWHFRDLDLFIPNDRVLFLNDSRVIRSRLLLKDAPYTKKNGEAAILKEWEIFFLKNQDHKHFEALVRPGNIFKIGSRIHAFWVTFIVEWMTDTGRTLRIEWGEISSILEQYGNLPLPPYIDYSREKEDDYQTVFAKSNGSVAAPTASLHFTDELLSRINLPKEYITLHVGLGTFQGIKTDDIREYAIHGEWIEWEKKLFDTIRKYKTAGKKIIATGTTVCRTLESLPYIWRALSESDRMGYTSETQDYWDTLTKDISHNDFIRTIHWNDTEWVFQCETFIYITPGFLFLIVDDLITNFHLPESSLLVLISAFIWYEETKKIYTHAIRERYRFFSFWDGMYIRGK